MFSYTLDIQFGFGEIGLATYPGNMEFKTDVQRNFQLQTKPPETSVDTRFPVIVDIDYSQNRAEMGYPGPHAAAAQWQGEAKQYVIDYIGQKASGGDALGAIENRVSIADVVESESFSEPPQVNVDLVPKTPPKITFQQGKVRGELIPGKVDVDVPDKLVNFDYHRGKVAISMAKTPYISIKAVPLGKNVDTLI